MEEIEKEKLVPAHPLQLPGLFFVFVSVNVSGFVFVHVFLFVSWEGANGEREVGIPAHPLQQPGLFNPPCLPKAQCQDPVVK